LETKVKEIELTAEAISRFATARKTLMVNLFAKQKILIDSITYWEELTCVGFNPELSQLEAVVSVKRETGYNGGLCSMGSTEYVRFFIDWGDGAGFHDVGLTSFRVYDISDAPPGPQHPLQYMVYLHLSDTLYRKCCDNAVTPKVRAVLAWNQIPSLNPNAKPHFGNSMDANVQIHPRNTILCLLKKIPVEAVTTLLENVDPEAALPKLKPQPVPWSKLAASYKEAGVPDHRLVYEAVAPMLFGGMPSMASEQPDIQLLEKLKIDVAKIVEFLSSAQANVTFEELVCAGLNTASDILGAVVHVKLPSGYSGDLCQQGSKEYVAFWADWDNNGIFDEYLGTATVETHDIAKLPAGGLYYSVMLPCHFAKRLKLCVSPNIVRIRAVLSWAVPPSTVDPDKLNYWGNRIDVVVQIRPGKPDTGLMDLIYDVGNVPLNSISTTSNLAFPSSGILDPNDCSRPAMDRPFGGSVRVGGRIYNTGPPKTVYFQVQYTQHGTSNWAPVTNSESFELMHPNPFDPLYPMETVPVVSPDGWFPYLEDPTAAPPIFERTNLLARWHTGALEGAYDIRLAYTKDYPITATSVIYYSKIVTIILDNTNYSVSPTPNSVVDPNYRLDLVIDGGDCHSYPQKSVIKGHLRALDMHFWKWVLELQPTTHTHGTEANPPCRCYGSTVDTGDANKAWTLDTSKLDTCGYTLTLWAYDRTIVDSNGAIVHQEKKAVGFSVT
jgi:hypothetical protein